MSALGEWAPYAMLILVGFLPNEVWRMLGVVLARGLDEEAITAEGDKSPGVLMASGYIAGGAIAGIVIAQVMGMAKDQNGVTGLVVRPVRAVPQLKSDSVEAGGSKQVVEDLERKLRFGGDRGHGAWGRATPMGGEGRGHCFRKFLTISDLGETSQRASAVETVLTPVYARLPRLTSVDAC